MKFEINDIVIGVSSHNKVSGIIMAKKITHLPFGMKTLKMYLIKKSDGMTEWINEQYLEKTG